MDDAMKIALLSDTHGNPLDEVCAALAAGKPQLVIHAGDLSDHYHGEDGRKGDPDDRAGQAKAFLETWNAMAEGLNVPVVVIPGNHDLFLVYPEEPGRQWTWDWRKPHPPSAVPPGWVPPEIEENLDPRVKILNGSGVRIKGLRVWGSPWTPWFGNWAYSFPDSTFNGEAEAEAHWATIPTDVDILVTHGPPRDILDHGSAKMKTGCPALRQQFDSGRIAPKVHVFGHIHAGRGQMTKGGTLFVNAAMCDDGNRLVHGPQWVEV